MVKKIKLSLIILILNLTTSFADNHQIQIQQSLDYLKDSLNQHQFNSLSSHLSEEFKFQDYSGDMALMIYQQIVNQYPKTVESIQIESITKEGQHYKVSSRFMFADESETKEIYLDSNYKIVKADIVAIQLAGHSPAKQNKQVKNSTYQDKITSPFKLVDRLIMVQAQVNGVQGDFMLDTGATGFILDSNKFPDLVKTARVDNQQAYGVGGKVENQKVATINSFKWQSIELNRAQANLWDLSKLEKNMGQPILGIIGADFLNQFTIEFDYKNQQVNLFSQDPIQQWQQKPDEILEFKMISHIPVIEVKVADKQLLFGIDSGAEGAMLMTRWKQPLSDEYELLQQETLNGVDGNNQIAQKVKLKEFTAGNQTYKNNIFIIADIQWGHESIIEGLLGSEFLSSRRTAIDFNNQKIYIWN
jgi:hypothetical protein